MKTHAYTVLNVLIEKGTIANRNSPPHRSLPPPFTQRDRFPVEMMCICFHVLKTAQAPVSLEDKKKTMDRKRDPPFGPDLAPLQNTFVNATSLQYLECHEW